MNPGLTDAPKGLFSTHRKLKRANAYHSVGNAFGLKGEVTEDLAKADSIGNEWSAPQSKVKEEVLTAALLDRDLSEVVDFERIDVSPYAYALNGQEYDPDPPVGPDGMCPICNNSLARKMDAFYLRHFDDRAAWTDRARGGYDFPYDMVLDHLVFHVGLIYGSAIPKDLKRIGNYDDQHFKDIHLSGVDWEVYKKMHTTPRAMAKEARRVAKECMAIPVRVQTAPVQSGSIGVALPDRSWYAYRGNKEIGQLRVWGDKRVKTEIETRRNDAVVFYDEMLDVRRMARRVYDEVMDGDTEGPRNYSAAIAAVREIKGVAMDLMKVALIATKIGDEKDRVRQISPGLRSMLDDMGIFDKDEPEPVEQADFEELQ
jgi:hypothetical protein